MSVGDSFTLFPLSNYFVRKSEAFGPAADPNAGPIPDPNVGLTQPIASGNVTASNVTGGTYTWYQVFRFAGAPNTQGAELKTYALVVRDFTTTNGTGNTDPIPLPQAFDNNFKVYKLFYDSMSTAHGNYTASVNSTSTGIVVNFGVNGPDALTPIVSDSFMFLVWGF
jgi:hypothetical protein